MARLMAGVSIVLPSPFAPKARTSNMPERLPGPSSPGEFCCPLITAGTANAPAPAIFRNFLRAVLSTLSPISAFRDLKLMQLLNPQQDHAMGRHGDGIGILHGSKVLGLPDIAHLHSSLEAKLLEVDRNGE